MKWFILAVALVACSLVASDAKAHQRFRRAVVPRQVVVRQPVVVRRPIVVRQFVAPVPVYGFQSFGVQQFSAGGCQGFFGY